MKNKTYLSLIIVTITGLFLMGCDDAINLQPNDKINKDATFKTALGIQKAYIGLYNIMVYDGWYQYDYTIYPDVMGGNAKFAPNAQTSRFSAEVAYNFNAGATSIFWEDGYFAINLACNILDNIDAIKDADLKDYSKGQIKGASLFARALAHFELVSLYAQPYLLNDPSVAPNANGQGGHLGVPILLKSEITKPARNTVAEVYAQVISDLLEAEATLPDEFVDAFSISKAAAQALLSRVYLYMGDYTNAATYASKVIGHYGLTLLTPSNYADAFGVGGGSESIFAVSMLKSNPDYAPGGETPFDIYNSPEVGGAYGDLCVSNDLYSLYEAGDARLSMFYEDERDASVIRTKKYFTLNYTIEVLRLSEMYLTRAEATVNSNPTSALADLNTIRTNRGLSTLTGITGSSLRTAILKERRLELAFEAHEIFDLTRTGRSLDREDNPVVDRKDISYPSMLFALPIPEAEFNGNPNMVQNPY